MIVKTSLAFAEYTDGELETFCEGVVASMTNNTHFPNPAVSLASLQQSAGQFQAALAAMAQGGKSATAAKNVARSELVTMLRQQALYVQTASANQLPVLFSSGFDAIRTNRAQSPLATPNIVEIKNDVSTQLLVRATPIPNARAYEVQVRTGQGEWKTAGLYTRARRMVLENLTPGTMYNVQVRAIGGSTGYSAWSDPVSRMAT